MGIWNSAAGMVTLELTSASLPEALTGINERGISVYDLQIRDELTASLRIYRRDYRITAALCRKRGDTVRVLHRNGIYWTLKGLLKRPVLVLGMSILLFFALFLPTRVLFVRVEGNSAVFSREIIAAAEACGIRFGASRREVRSERMKNALLEEIPRLQWAGVNTYGCVAVISVRERTVTEVLPEQGTVSSIVACHDGIVISCTAERGTSLCVPGQAVTAGQVLISGYTDCGICIQASNAKGEVFALTERRCTAVTPRTTRQRIGDQAESVKISLLIGKKRINLWKDSGISEGSCGRMYEEYYITLPGGFQLPVGIAVERSTVWETEDATVSGDAAQQLLQEFCEGYLNRQMIAGTISGRQLTASEADGLFCVDGVYSCEEMIGRIRQERMEHNNGKAD